jgi:hypothetical protein
MYSHLQRKTKTNLKPAREKQFGRYNGRFDDIGQITTFIHKGYLVVIKVKI